MDFDAKTEEVVSCLIECHEKPFNNMKPKKILNLVNTLGEENIPLLLDLRKADIMAQNPEYLNRLEELPNIEERFQQITEIDFKIRIQEEKKRQISINNINNKVNNTEKIKTLKISKNDTLKKYSNNNKKI